MLLRAEKATVISNSHVLYVLGSQKLLILAQYSNSSYFLDIRIK